MTDPGTIRALEAEHRAILADLDRFLALVGTVELAERRHPGTVTAAELAELAALGDALEARYATVAAAVRSLRAGLAGGRH